MFIYSFRKKLCNIHGQRSKGKIATTKGAQQAGYDDQQSIPMISSKAFFLLCLIFIHATRAFAQTSFVYEYCDNAKGNYTTNSTYNANLNSIMSSFPPRDDNSDGFYSSTISFYGQSDEVYVVGLCRGDIERDICRSCLNHSKHLLPKVCPNQKEAIGGFNECMLRYSNKSSLGSMFAHPRFNLWNTQNVSSSYVNVFLQDLRTLLNTLKNQAVIGGSQEKFSVGNKTIQGFQTINAFVQCTPDLSQQSCEDCLDESFGDITNHNEWIGGRVVTPSCNFRYEIYPFKGQSYEEPPKSYLQSTIRLSSQSSTTNNGSKRGKKSSRTIIISSVVPSVAVMGIIITFGVYTRMKKTSDRNSAEDPLSEAVEEVGCSKCFQFDFSTIKRATNNFSSQNRIGSGFGTMYRGKLLNGQRIAVKRLKGLQANQCFKNELQISSKLQHRNLVTLLGFGVKGDEKFLVYEYVPKNLINSFIFDQSSGEQTYLDWDIRHKIIKGVSRGLLYLHEGYPSIIIHRDIKPCNILLDEDMNPKISDFEFAKSFEADQSDDTSSAVFGTFGYIAPECAMMGIISVKIDVYSFGVLLLEVVCGRRNFSTNMPQEDFLVNTVRRSWMEGTASNLINHIRIINELEFASIMRCIHIGLLCIEEEADSRPTMGSVVHMLSCDSVSLPVLSQQYHGRQNSPDNHIESRRSLSLDFDLTYSSEIEFPSAPIIGIRVVVLCWKFIRILRHEVYFRRMNA